MSTNKFIVTRVFTTKHFITAFIFTMGVLLAVSSKSQTTKPGIFYAVTGNGIKDTSWIFGTYHLVNNSYLNDKPVVQKAFNKSKGVVVEIIIDSSKLVEARTMGLMKDKTLTDLLDKPFSDSLESELKAIIGVGIAEVNNFKPINVSLTLSIVHLINNNNVQLSQYKGQPLDAFFVAEGKQTAKHITALETMEEQMDIIFNKTSLNEQINQLKSFIRNKNESIKLGDELMKSWFDNDLQAMNTIYENTLKISGDNDYLLNDRNNKWIKTIPSLLQKESQFIAVGALHLAGTTGLVNQLRQLGFTVTPIKF